MQIGSMEEREAHSRMFFCIRPRGALCFGRTLYQFTGDPKLYPTNSVKAAAAALAGINHRVGKPKRPIFAGVFTHPAPGPSRVVCEIRRRKQPIGFVRRAAAGLPREALPEQPNCVAVLALLLTYAHHRGFV